MKVYKEIGDKELREYGVLPWGEKSPGTHEINGTKRQYAGVILQGGEHDDWVGECLFDVTEDFKKLTSGMTADELDAFESDCCAKDDLWHSFHAKFMKSTGMEIHDGPFEVCVSDLIEELKDKIEGAEAS